MERTAEHGWRDTTLKTKEGGPHLSAVLMGAQVTSGADF